MWDFLHSEDISAYLECLMNLTKYLYVLDSDKDKFFLFARLALKHIWDIHNARIHDGKAFEISISVHTISSRFEEFLLFSTGS